MNYALICVALRYLDPDYLARCQLGHIWRKPPAKKAAALIAHDRILNNEMGTRGLPKFLLT